MNTFHGRAVRCRAASRCKGDTKFGHKMLCARVPYGQALPFGHTAGEHHSDDDCGNEHKDRVRNKVDHKALLRGTTINVLSEEHSGKSDATNDDSRQSAQRENLG